MEDARRVRDAVGQVGDDEPVVNALGDDEFAVGRHSRVQVPWLRPPLVVKKRSGPVLMAPPTADMESQTSARVSPLPMSLV